MLTTVRHIFGRIMHSETALHSQWDKGRKNNLLFASPSIRRPTLYADDLVLFLNLGFQGGNQLPTNGGRLPVFVWLHIFILSFC